mgnify:CR=1 FL=1
MVHPGIHGDRGISAIDWALLNEEPEWGVTVLQAVEEMDAGDIWATHNFPVPQGVDGAGTTKSALYQNQCVEAGITGLREALVAGRPVVVTDVCGYAHHIGSAVAGIVLPSPFDQAQLNQAVHRMLDGYYRGQCRERGLEYASRVDLYSMHSTGALLIEQLAAARTGGSQ